MHWKINESFVETWDNEKRQVEEGFKLVSHPNLLKSYMLEFYQDRKTVEDCYEKWNEDYNFVIKIIIEKLRRATLSGK